MGCTAAPRPAPPHVGAARTRGKAPNAVAIPAPGHAPAWPVQRFPQSPPRVSRRACGARAGRGTPRTRTGRQNRPQSRRPHRGFSLRAIAEPRRRPAVPTTHCPAVLGGRDTPGRVSIRRRFHIRTEGGGSMARRVSDPRSCGIHNPGPLPSSQCPRIGSHSAVPAGGLAPRARGPLPSDSPGPRLITVVSHLPSPGLTFSLLSLLTLKK